VHSCEQAGTWLLVRRRNDTGDAMSAREWWRTSTVLAAAASLAVVAPALGTQVPVVISPADSTEVSLGYRGPVRIDYTGVAPGTYHVEVTDDEPCGGLHSESLADVTVTGETGPVSRPLLDPIDKPGLYRVSTWLDGSTTATTSTFSIPGGEPPTVLSPGRLVRLGEPWTLRIDWSDTRIGCYDLDAGRVGGGAVIEWWEEMFPNHEDRRFVTYQMDPLTVKGKYYIRLGPWRTYFQAR
jgi:hypothetical protein